MKNAAIIILTAIVCVSCASTRKKNELAALEKAIQITEQNKMFYAESPKTIAVMPPINRTNHVEVKEYLYTTLSSVLAEKGFYVFSPMLTMDLFQAESSYDAEQFIGSDLSKFNEVMGADAVLFTTVNKWKKYYYLTSAGVKVNIDYVLRSTKTGNTLYYQTGDVTLDTSMDLPDAVEDIPIIGQFADMIATAISLASTKRIKVARMCNSDGLLILNAGKYSPNHIEVSEEDLEKGNEELEKLKARRDALAQELDKKGKKSKKKKDSN